MHTNSRGYGTDWTIPERFSFSPSETLGPQILVRDEIDYVCQKQGNIVLRERKVWLEQALVADGSRSRF